MSRRQDTPVPEYSHARKAPEAQKATQADAKTAKVLTQESYYAFDPGTPVTGTTGPPDAPNLPPTLDRTTPFVTQAEIDAAMKLYKRDGLCPLCGVRIGGRSNGRGMTGHISKCLRLSKFKTASTTTS